MNIHQQFLAELHPGLTSEDESFDNSIAIEMKAFDKALGSIGDKYKDYNDDIKAEKTNADVLSAYDNLNAKLTEITAKPLGDVSVEENELSRKIASSLSLADDDPALALLNFYQAKSDREEISLMTPVERREAFDAHAKAGNPRLLRAVNGLLKPEALISKPFLNDARKQFINTAFADEVSLIKELKAKVHHIAKMRQAVPFAVNKIAKGRGIDIEAALQARKDSHNKALHSRSLDEKLRALKQKGFRAYQADYQ